MIERSFFSFFQVWPNGRGSTLPTHSLLTVVQSEGGDDPATSGLSASAAVSAAGALPDAAGTSGGAGATSGATGVATSGGQRDKSLDELTVRDYYPVMRLIIQPHFALCRY